MKMDPFWEKQKLDNLYTTILNYYDPLSQGMGLPWGSYKEWQPYLVGHLGGYGLQTGRPDVWLALQQDMYERNYLNRNLVFNQQLGIPPMVTNPTWIATNTSSFDQYISIPVLWRNYYNIAGYHYNKYSGELWLEPVLFESLNNQLDNVLVITPDGYVNVSYNSYGNENQNQHLIFKSDQPMNVNSIYVWDKYADSLSAVKLVQVNGTDVAFTRSGNGDLTHMKLNWTGTINTEGITVQIEGDAKPVGIDESSNSKIPDNYLLEQNYPNPFNPSTNIEFSIPKSEYIELKVYNIVGEEISTLVSKKLNPGNHMYTFDGKNLASGIYYYQLVAGDFREVKKMILLR